MDMWKRVIIRSAHNNTCMILNPLQFLTQTCQQNNSQVYTPCKNAMNALSLYTSYIGLKLYRRSLNLSRLGSGYNLFIISILLALTLLVLSVSISSVC